jgi:hypothetical protein
MIDDSINQMNDRSMVASMTSREWCGGTIARSTTDIPFGYLRSLAAE